MTRTNNILYNMTQTDYEQKKREYWEEFRIKNPAFNDMLGRKIFNQIYDRAYALGRAKEPISQEDVEKAAEAHADELRVSHSIPGALMPMLHDIAKTSYRQGAQDFIGKQEKSAEGEEMLTVSRKELQELYMGYK